MNFVDIYQQYWKNGYVLTDTHLSGIDREMFRTLFNPVAEIFRKYPAGYVHLYLPGTGNIQGRVTGNYQDSAGTTQAAVDQPVGLVLDAAGSVGTDLVANGSFAVDSGWTKGAGVTISGGVCNIAAGAGYLEQAIPTASGKTYWVTATNAGNAVYSGAWSSSGQSGALSGSPCGRGVGTNKFEFVATGSTSYIGFTATGAGALTIDNVIVREVTGIHASQSTPGYKPTLRRVSGVNYLEFDGVDDRLALGGPLFQMSDDHCVVAAIKLAGTPSGVYDVFTQRGATGTPIVCELNINGSRLPVATWRDDAGVLLQLAGPSALVVGQPYVIAARKVGNAQTLWVNGVIVASSNTVFGATTITTAGIGGDSQAAGGNYFKGAIYDVNPVKGTLTDTDVVTESKFAASLSGIQL